MAACGGLISSAERYIRAFGGMGRSFEDLVSLKAALEVAHEVGHAADPATHESIMKCFHSLK